MKKYILASIPIAFITGCVMTTEPAHDLGFTEAKDLTAFDGCYENCSDTSDGSAFACLSYIIWPGQFKPKNKPDDIYVKSEANNKLVVTALKDGTEVKKSSFKIDEDFYFDGGRIELKREYIASGATEPGNVFIGVGTGKTVLGIDAEGEGRVQQSATFAGTGFLIIPIAASGTDISKIKRKGSLCNES